MTTAIADQPSRQKGYVPTYKSRQLPGSTYSNIVPAHLLAAVLRPAIEKVDRGLAHGFNLGARAVIAERAATHLDVKPEAVVRRLYDVLTGKCRQVQAGWADAVLMAVDEEDNDGILELPVGLPAALDRIEMRCELQGIKLKKRDKREMAKDLVEWSRLIVHDGFEALTATTPAERLNVLRKHHPAQYQAAVDALVPTNAEVIELPVPVRVPEEELVAA